MPDETTRTEIMGEPGILRVEMQQERRNLTAKLLEASAPYLKATNGVFMISTLYRDSREVLVRGSLFLNPSNTYSNGANLQGYHTEDEAAAEFARIRAAIAHYCAEWKRLNGAASEQSAAPKQPAPPLCSADLSWEGEAVVPSGEVARLTAERDALLAVSRALGIQFTTNASGKLNIAASRNSCPADNSREAFFLARAVMEREGGAA